MSQGDGGAIELPYLTILYSQTSVTKTVWPSALRWYELLSAAYSTFEGRAAKSLQTDQSLSGQTMFDGYDGGRPVRYTSLLFCFRGMLNTCGQMDKEMCSRMMAQLLGLDFSNVPQANGHAASAGNPVPVDSRMTYTPATNTNDGFSDSSYSPEMLQWIQSYPDPPLPLHCYDLQSFT